MEFINQNILLISIVVVSFLGLIWQTVNQQRGGNTLSPAQATLLINRENALVLDVRAADEFAAGHLPDALHIPLDKLTERVGEIDKYKDKPIIVCCGTGMRSGKAVSQLRKAGFSALHNLAGGVDAWVAASYPLTKGGRRK